MTSPEALAAALGPDRTLLPDPPERELSDEERFLAWIVAERRPGEDFALWVCTNDHLVVTDAEGHEAAPMCTRRCAGMARLARVTKRETADA